MLFLNRVRSNDGGSGKNAAALVAILPTVVLVDACVNSSCPFLAFLDLFLLAVRVLPNSFLDFIRFTIRSTSSGNFIWAFACASCRRLVNLILCATVVVYLRCVPSMVATIHHVWMSTYSILLSRNYKWLMPHRSRTTSHIHTLYFPSHVVFSFVVYCGLWLFEEP